MKYKIVLAYDGTAYVGWQYQPAQPTIQGRLNSVLERLAGEPVVTHAAGRTDAGVHAEGQVVSFDLPRFWAARELVKALNGNLPADIRALAAESVAASFHARFDARAKTYRYRIAASEVMSPFLARYAWHYPYPLDNDRLRRDALTFVGRHDFLGFTIAEVDTKTTVRTLTEARVERDGSLLEFYFSGEGFLRYQVRTMVAALLAINRGRLAVDSMAELIARRDRRLIGAPAPAQGLTLMKVEY